jgi:REP-associated tyrosine transposase
MPRQARLDAPGVLHHVVCRGIERSKIFTDEADHDDFVVRLAFLLTETQTSCYAWALIPNHFHLLLRTDSIPLSSVMRRLLTGYAVSFNRRHKRSGHLFQNRYKSIICQNDRYLLELVRYIHLNPLRAGLVSSLKELAEFPNCGHRQLLGLGVQGLVAADEVLPFFAKTKSTARKRYAAFVADGVELGKQPELAGGGLIRSLAGQLKGTTAVDDRMTSDERILGDSDFIASILRQTEQQLTSRQRYRHAGVGAEELATLVVELLEIDKVQVRAAGKQPNRVQARSLFCFWAVRELGVTATSLARELGISQPAVSQAVQRGDMLATERGWKLADLIKL